MNLNNEDYFYIDAEKIYNLKYTHEQLVALLKKIEDNEVLSKEQYKQLIEEIGLDNISTFDLNYYNLKNLPYIPVRLGDLYNDVGYDVKARVDNELNTLEEIINSEIIRLDSVIAEVKSLNVSEVLEQIQNAQDKADYIDKSIKDLNGVIFSFERSIELMQDKTSEISIEFETLMNMQETDESRLNNLFEIITVHTEDIQKLLSYYEIEKNKLSDVLTVIDDIKIAVNDLSDYQGIMKNIDLRISDVETFIKLINPKELDLENLLLLESRIKKLQEKVEEHQLFYENISQQVDELTSELQNNLDVINNNISLIQETINEHATTLLNHDNHLADHNERLESLNSKLGIITTSVNKNISDIKNINVEIESLKERLGNNAVDTLNRRMDALETNFLILQSRTSTIEDNIQTLATKEALNSINMQMHINEQGYVVVELFIEGNVVSSIRIPYNVKIDDQIARTDSARTDHSKIM